MWPTNSGYYATTYWPADYWQDPWAVVVAAQWYVGSVLSPSKVGTALGPSRTGTALGPSKVGRVRTADDIER